MTKQKELSVLFSAGGTGGHVVPCAVLYRYLKKHARRTVITDQTHWFAESSGIFASPYLKRTRSIFKSIVVLTKERLAIIKEQKPTHIICFGSLYCMPSFLAFLIWRLQGHSCKLLLHEQNAILGRMHQLMQYFASTIFTAFPTVQKISPLCTRKVVMVGTPTRSAPQLSLIHISEPTRPY